MKDTHPPFSIIYIKIQNITQMGDIQCYLFDINLTNTNYQLFIAFRFDLILLSFISIFYT